MPLIDHFGILAPLYDRVIHPPGDQNLSDLVDFNQHTLLLDAAAGTGRISRGLVEEVHHIVACDISRPMLAQADPHPQYSPTQADLDHLPFPNNYFDRIIIVDAVHHVLNPENVLAELWRILAPGGKLIVEEPDIRHFRVKLVALAEKITFFQSHFLTAETIKTILETFSDTVSIHPDAPNVRVLAEKRLSVPVPSLHSE